jgi:hypothetical protein
VALGTVTPFILGYRVLGGEVVASNAPEFIATTVSRTETFEMTFINCESNEPVVASVIAASAIVLPAVPATSCDNTESSNARVTSRQLFADLREGRAPESLFRQVSVNSPEEIEMESLRHVHKL